MNKRAILKLRRLANAATRDRPQARAHVLDRLRRLWATLPHKARGRLGLADAARIAADVCAPLVRREREPRKVRTKNRAKTRARAARKALAMEGGT